MLERPQPPSILFDDPRDRFIPAPEVEAWLRAAFLDNTSPLYNVEHDHLNSAVLGLLWTNKANRRHMKQIAGEAETPMPHGTWGAKGWALCQLEEWFGVVPDFVITLSAGYAKECGDVEFCALVEHEMYHCAQKLDLFGLPSFTKEGKPKFGIRGHDVEEFVGVVRRYGVRAGAGESFAFVTAAISEPEIAVADVASLCGTCAR